MERLGYYNGKYGPLEQMTIPMNDRVSWFGDGVYDAGPSRNYKIFALDEHVDRFFRSAAALRIVMPVTKQELKDLLNRLVKEMDTGNLFVYYQVTRGTGVRKHAFTEGPGNLWITLNPAEILDGRTPVQLVTTEDTRFFHCDLKTLNLIPSVMASQKAKEAGCAEAVFYRPGGRVTECAHSNVHILKGGILYTAPTDHLILPGIARAHLLRACAALGIEYREEAFHLDDLFHADEIIVTSSSHLCLHADQIDGIDVGGKDAARYEKLRSYLLNEFYQATSIVDQTQKS
ncbi:MAG TPA: D-amino acid aminotransferase [Lachnospiraceae bacterium]|nr:D-amino acid aminotransferase [Lachnospiraceae bacterium]